MDYCSSPDTLTLSIPGGPTLDLMSDQQGFRVQTLDLGYPAVRDDVNLRADAFGEVDLTRLFGARAVTINGALVPSPAGSRQQGWHLLAPFLDPAQRVTLTYRVDPDAVIKTLTVRAADATALFDNPTVSPAQLGFKAPDPLAYDANLQTVYMFATGASTGRAYNLTFNRTYPAGGTTQVFTANNGDFTVYPLLRLYGPMTGPRLNFSPAGAASSSQLNFQAAFYINAGDYVEVDCRRRTALLNGNPAGSVYGNLIFPTAWPYIPAGSWTSWALFATGTSSASQVQINWQNPYLL